jgi:hypothetical protein
MGLIMRYVSGVFVAKARFAEHLANYGKLRTSDMDTSRTAKARRRLSKRLRKKPLQMP